MVIYLLKRVCYPDSISLEPKYKAKLIGTFSSDIIPRKGEVIVGFDDEAYDVVEVVYQFNRAISISGIFIEIVPHNYYARKKTDTAYSLITELERDTN